MNTSATKRTKINTEHSVITNSGKGFNLSEVNTNVTFKNVLRGASETVTIIFRFFK
jgi:hypothetical protein